MSNTVSTVFVARQNPNLFTLKYTNKSVSFTPSGDAYRLDTAINISNVATTNPVVVTTSLAHGYSNGDEVFISGVVGTTEVNNRSFTVANVTTFTFELLGINGLSYTAYISGGIVRKLL